MKTIFATISLVAVLSSTGCTIITSDSDSSSSGTEISDSTIAQLQIGKTTKEWLVATLGPPSSMSEVGDQVEILTYTATRTTTKKAGLIVVFKSNTKKEEKETAFFEFTDGVLSRYWKTEG